MKSYELDAARRLITKVLAHPSIGPDQRDALRRAKREMDKIAQSGKLDRNRVFRITETIATILFQALQANEAARRSQ